MSKIVTVRKFGTSLVITVPKSIAQYQGIEKGTKMELTIFPKGLTFVKVE